MAKAAATWVTLVLWASGCAANRGSPAGAPRASVASRDASPLGRLQGRWRFDVETSLRRCERLALHDCREWASTPAPQRDELRQQYRAAFATLGGQRTRDGRLIFEGTTVTMDHFLAMNTVQTSAVRDAHAEGDRVTLTLADGADVRTTSFEFVDGDHLCIVERGPNSDVLCLERLADGQR